jgi:predicted GNAT family acetyltransferase
MRAEVENSLILGIADALARDVSPTSEPPYLSTVEINGNVVACALRTPPHKLALTRCDHPEAMMMLATDALSIYPDLATALGPEPDVEVFAAAWSALTGRRVQRGMRQRLHEIRQLRPLRNPPPGKLRPANAADLQVVMPWISAFFDEIPGVIREDPAELANARLKNGALFVWDNRGPVSMAGWSGKTANGVRVNLVYTPRELRSRGYATACVSALTEVLLAQGNRYCCLYTNLANPVSNRLYQRIGYRPVCDFSDFEVLQQQ